MDTLENYLLEFTEKAYPDGYWILMDENARSHVSKKVKLWKDENVPLNIDHPPYSPDINAIEFV